jgi:hypothetical protein
MDIKLKTAYNQNLKCKIWKYLLFWGTLGLTSKKGPNSTNCRHVPVHQTGFEDILNLFSYILIVNCKTHVGFLLRNFLASFFLHENDRAIFS